MNNQRYFYITTTLPYVNAEPHVGFAMELVRADTIARHKKLLGYTVFLNTGTDEHGQKLWDAAQKEGVPVQAYVDRYADEFKKLKDLLTISDDVHFIRTTDPRHEYAAQAFWKRCCDNGYIYKKMYTTNYCVGCELEKTDSELTQDGQCAIHPTYTIEHREEENYFFKFSAFEDKLLALYQERPNFIVPAFRQNEMKAFVERGLQDFSISRVAAKMPWGIPVPGDDTQVLSVWFDALVNYIATLGWPDDTQTFESFWVHGTPTQYCGKDNVRQQTAMWQAMLMAAGLPNSHQIVINGFFTGEGGIKMSKSLGNVINPQDVVATFGADAFRYYVTREVSMFEDAPFYMSKFKEVYNGSLANGLGNLASRTLAMAQSYDVSVATVTFPAYTDVAHPAFDDFNITAVMESIWKKLHDLDKYIQTTEPFKTIQTDKEKAHTDIIYVLQGLADVSVMLLPCMPTTAEALATAIRTRVKPETPLFARKD